LADEQFDFYISKWGNMDNCSSNLSDDRIDLADPFSTGQLHDLTQFGCVSSKRCQHATFMAYFTYVRFKAHASTDSSRRRGTYQGSLNLDADDLDLRVRLHRARQTCRIRVGRHLLHYQNRLEVKV
tara:strand:+ start:249 stop:626 length:378 start_codon:yes stop_codon:yes gene_type:complete